MPSCEAERSIRNSDSGRYTSGRTTSAIRSNSASEQYTPYRRIANRGDHESGRAGTDF